MISQGTIMKMITDKIRIMKRTGALKMWKSWKFSRKPQVLKIFMKILDFFAILSQKFSPNRQIHENMISIQFSIKAQRTLYNEHFLENLAGILLS